jgi:hypothetical protein
MIFLIPLLVFSLLAAPLPAKPKKPESPMAALQRRLNGVWQAQDDPKLRLEIRRDAGQGGTIYFSLKDQQPYEKSAFRVIARDRIKLLPSGQVYIVTFWREAMAWTLPGGQRKRRFVGLHLKTTKGN